MAHADVSVRARALARVAEGEPLEDVALQCNIPADRLRRWAGVEAQVGKSAAKTRSGAGAVTILDIAEHTGLSKSVVARALRGQYGVSDEARARVENAAQELGYVSNAAAQRLSSYRTNTLGVLVRDASAPFYGEMQSALQRRGTQIRRRVFITSGALDRNDERRALEDLIALRVDGLIVCSGRLSVRQVLRFSDRYPLVVAGRAERHPKINSVFGDEDAGAGQLAQHLLERGHRRIGVLWPSEDISPILHRRAEVMASAVGSGGGLVSKIDLGPPEDIRAEMVSGLDAVMAPNDRYAAGLLMALGEAGRLPVTGFDGVGGLASELVGLTTWRQPVEAIGRRAIDRLVQLIGERDKTVEHIAIPGTVRVSRSTVGA